MPGPDQEAVAQHEWVINKWDEEDGTVGSEHYCQACYRQFDFSADLDDEYYSACPEYDGDDDGQSQDVEDRE